jgi:hypothetical protein
MMGITVGGVTDHFGVNFRAALARVLEFFED